MIYYYKLLHDTVYYRVNDTFRVVIGHNGLIYIYHGYNVATTMGHRDLPDSDVITLVYMLIDKEL